MLDWLYDELGPPERARVDEHLRGCAACREAGASRRWIRTSMRRLPEEDPPAALSVRLVHEAARHALDAQGPPVWARLEAWLARVLRLAWAHPAAAAVATLVLVAGMAGALHMHGRDLAGPEASAPAAASSSLPPRPPPPPPSEEPGVLDDTVVMGLDQGGEKEIDEAMVTRAGDQKQDQGGRPASKARREAKKKSGPEATAEITAEAKSAPGDRRKSASRAGAAGRAAAVTEGRLAAVPRSAAAGLLDGAPQAQAPAPDRDAAGERQARAEARVRAPGETADRTRSLHDAVRQALRNGQCRTALRLARTLRQQDPGFYRRRLAPDGDLRACQRTLAAEGDGAPSRGEASPGDGEGAAATKKAAPADGQ